MKKELFKIFGPLICAFLLLGIFLGLPLFNRGKISKEKMREISYSQSTNIFKGRYVKNQAFSGKYVPFFGSSELSRLDALHPSILAEKYHRNYQPFLLGNAGSQSLAHFYSMQPVNSALHGKKAVFIISPQWFVKDGTDDEAFSLYYSNLEGVNWILNSKDSRATRYAASRLLAMPTGSSDKLMEMALKKKEKGKPLGKPLRWYLEYRRNVLENEDHLFSMFKLNDRTQKVDRAMKKLPERYSVGKLDAVATKLGENATGNNPFDVSKKFWNKRLKGNYKKLKGKQADYDYTQSPEFADFQLVLQQFKDNNMDVIFIIPPVNRKWMEYTGLSQEMLDRFDKKIIYQLQSQGFNNICDMTNVREEPYFMQDTIHLGWRGWLAADTYISPFMASEFEAPHYKMNDMFYSKGWQNLSGSGIDDLK